MYQIIPMKKVILMVKSKYQRSKFLVTLLLEIAEVQKIFPQLI